MNFHLADVWEGSRLAWFLAVVLHHWDFSNIWIKKERQTTSQDGRKTTRAPFNSCDTLTKIYLYAFRSIYIYFIHLCPIWVYNYVGQKLCEVEMTSCDSCPLYKTGSVYIDIILKTGPAIQHTERYTTKMKNMARGAVRENSDSAYTTSTVCGHGCLKIKAARRNGRDAGSWERWEIAE